MRFLVRMAKAVAVAVGVMVVVAGLFLAYHLSRVDSARGEASDNQRFSIQRGEGVTDVAKRLEQAGIIDGSLTFVVYAMKTGLYRQFQVGEYTLSGQMSIPDIINRFVEGKVIPAGVRITFPEGWTIREMAERLTENGLAGADFQSIAERPFPKWRDRYPFLQDLPPEASLEGYLFPDTYIFPAQATGELLVNELLKNFGEKAEPILLEGLAARGLTMHQTVILASIIEEEGRTEDDRRNISDVFRKRLAIGQPLQSDATINYIHGTAKDQPTLDDLKSSSPYNTYAYAGLPIGPIGNPSLMSLKAALYPIANPYFYFLIDLQTRITYYAVDFEGHSRNRAAYGL